MLLLPGTVLDAGVTFAERVRKQVEATYIHVRRDLDSSYRELRRVGVAASADRRLRRA